MINQYKNFPDIKIYGDTGVLEYYSLNGISSGPSWATLRSPSSSSSASPTL